ncbi:aldehyde ferredoxin oxidoreductase family protein [Neomoorella mulderi]|uniref:Putative oxidoreductase YdhV n=1 Tax=Moorella mulderi DSM 14980 TaxID=1122241 RepID=A0A151B139_9FIRM|nr:aldehyde ferredoxin oxidoreductase family protein [Moorella mulderi]KYH33530.1 putative oxidoreductase YdhV [Moorella mulderi DSM 14980]
MERQILRVNLSDGSIRQEDIPAKVCRDFIGGRPLAARYLYGELAAGVEPLSPENILIFSAGPLAGSGARGVNRWLAVTKSPLSGGFIRSVGGSDFGAWLHGAGYEILFLTGQAAEPVYLYLGPRGRVELRPANDLWGQGTQATQAELRRRHGREARVACIGPAGENLVRYASIVSNHSTAARGGVGTVMGAKKLKAIVVDTETDIPAANRELWSRLLERQRELIDRRDHRAPLPGAIKGAILPTRNFQGAWQADVDTVNQPHLLERGGPEFQTCWALGANPGHFEPDLVAAANERCNDLGLDTVSTGGSIAFAYELQQRGLLKAEGLDLGWERPETTLELIRMIAYRMGLGELLAEGVSWAAEHIGSGAVEYAMTIKGIEMPGYDPRVRPLHGLGMVVSALGGSYCYGKALHAGLFAADRQGEDLADQVSRIQETTVALETGIGCLFAYLGGWLPLELMTEMLTAFTGTELALEDLYMAAERSLALERAFNLREGLGREADTLPERFLREGIADGGIKAGPFTRLPELVQAYYHHRGWDEEGRPTPATLDRLGLELVRLDQPREFKVAFSRELI